MTMKRLSGTLSLRLLVWLLAASLAAVSVAWAKPTTPKQAQTAVMNWLGLDAVPLDAAMGRQIKEVKTFYHGRTPAYFVVHLNPSGLVFVPADDLVEPIIGFLAEGVYDPSPANPLGALVSRDIPGRVVEAQALEARGLEFLAPETPQIKARRKWALLTQPTGPKASEFGLSSISDVRVAPLLESRWDQDTVNYQACYNYYTPPNAEGSASNYPCGCVATAMAQLMRYWEYPVNGIGSLEKTYYVNDPDRESPLTGYTRGGDDYGGAYVWSEMVLAPATSGVNLSQRRAIGRLTWDAGLSVAMEYESGSSGTDTLLAANAFTGTFGYTNAKKGYNSGSNLPATNRNAMVNPNLHARYPVLFGIVYYYNGKYYRGHAIVCDGYGYNSSTMYHHLNMGWANSYGSDAWYNLPTIDPPQGDWNSVYKCIYNVYTSGSGEIIAGRVTDDSSPPNPLSGVTVTATGTGGPYTATTDANGIYALAKVPSSTTFTVSASKSGYNFTSQSVTTGYSPSYSSINTGNKWPIDFVGVGVVPPTLNQALDNTDLSFSTSGNANWFGEYDTWYYGGSAAQSGAITDSQSSRLQTTVVGPGTLSFYWQVSCEEGYDFLIFLIDSKTTNLISGEKGWTKVTKTIPRGIHTIAWLYYKDMYISYGSDCGWVDKVEYTRSEVKTISPVYELLLLN
jgi:hypothetical protein